MTYCNLAVCGSRNGLTQHIGLQIIHTFNKFNIAIICNQRFIEIVTFLVILTFQAELGESTQTPAQAPADQKTPELRQSSGPRCTALKSL